MPEVSIVFFRKADKKVPMRDFLERLSDEDQVRCLARIKWLKDRGRQVGPPVSMPIRDGIHELRVAGPAYETRMLYFIHGEYAVILTCELVEKDGQLPSDEIDRAVRRKAAFEKYPELYACTWE